MNTPETLFGWVNLLAGLWAAVAYALAAVAGVRALDAVSHSEKPPAPPVCLIVEATRWLFLRPVKRAWTLLDFVGFATFILVVSCVVGAAATIDFLSSFDWRKLGHYQSLQRFGADILTGSALIVLFAGITSQSSRREE